jgi:non-ribosomal peptide synthetase component F
LHGSDDVRVALLEEVFPTLVAGATVVLPTSPILETGADLSDYVTWHSITGFELTAPYWQEWVAGLLRDGRPVPACVRFVAMGGERVSPDQVPAWQRLGVPLVQVYGLTEATVTSTYFRLDPDPHSEPQTLPLGAPMPGVALHVLDDRLRAVGPDVLGELFVDGGLARGYLGQPGTTASSFVPSRFGPPGARGYRTGDLVRRDAAGHLVYLGRFDDQVKLRGFRIHLADCGRSSEST